MTGGWNFRADGEFVPLDRRFDPTLDRPIEAPAIGAAVLFKLRGAFVAGTVAGGGTDLRLPISRGRSTYWRNRSQLFARPTYWPADG